MKKLHAYARPAWTVAGLACLSIMAGIAFCRIEPSGRKAGLIQFDAIIELNTEEADPHTVVFARYWVCQNYYAVSVLWCEPHAGGLMYIWRTLAILSDSAGLRMSNEIWDGWALVNTTYPKPFAERGPFQSQGGGLVRLAGIRFAEQQALARCVYVSDLASLKDAGQGTDGVVNVTVPQGVNGGKRTLAQLKVHTQGDRVESMELFDGRQQRLGTMKYEYDRGGNVPGIARLVADLPARHERLAIDSHGTGDKQANKIADVDFISHKGGRTCTVTYKDVTIGDQVSRLPVHVEARVSENRRLLRSARLINFQRVSLDKAGVWEAAKAFVHRSDEDQAYDRLARKYIPSPFERKLAPVTVDPNDLAFVRKLIAKYPVPEMPRASHESKPQARMEREERDLSPEARAQQARARAEARKQEWAQQREQMKEQREQAAKAPRPPRTNIEPNDVRMMRRLCADYHSRRFPPLTPEQRKLLKEQGWFAPGGSHMLSESEREIGDLEQKLRRVLSYHRVPLLPEDKPPQVEPADCELIQQLQAHYEKLAAQQDRGLGGQLKAVDALTRLDRMRRDYDVFEGHTLRYLKMIQDANLVGMYTVGGYDNIEILVEAGQYEKANKLLRQWADQSAAEDDAETIYGLVNEKGRGPELSWASIHLLDRFLRRPGLTPVQRYEGLALRAIALDKVDRLLADPETDYDELRKVPAQWVLSTTTRAEVANRIGPALREAVAAWGAIGAARLSEAKPYSTAHEPALTMNLHGFPEATPLQEISALLDNVVRERTPQTSAGLSKPGR
jgi:hypothetical protein